MSQGDPSVAARARELFEAHADGIRRKTNRTMAGLLAGQWVFAIVLAITVSPYGWEGKTRAVHAHVWAAVVLGGAISSLPIALTLLRPSATITRHVVAVAQMLWSALLIHLTGGRLETHFHVFGSLAFLAFYRDWRVLVPATVVVAGDHLLRQLVWPESVYGIPNPEWWRFLEHAGWVVFEDVFLVLACVRGVDELRKIATTRAELEATTEREAAKSRALDVALGEAIVARDAAQKANQVKGQFLANMSHELRTPIGGVIGMTELIGVTELTPKQSRYVDTIRTSGQTLLLVVNDILEFSKMEANKTALEARRMSPADVARSVVDSSMPAAEKKGLELSCSVAADVPARLSGDAGRLHQILGNIVANAVKFTDQGAVSVRVSTVQAAADATVLRFEIEDTGIGIAEGDLPRLFQAFSQVDGSNSRKYGGTGLGLVIARHLVELMSGEIGVSSQRGKGSKFWFTARFAPSEADSAPAPISAARGSGSGARLLVAEDNPVNQEVAAEMLAQLGYRVDLVSNGEQALQALENNEYAAVLMDCQMPIMDGYAAATEIKKRHALRRPPVIAVTAHALPGDRDKAISAGMDDYLTKPLTLDRLGSVLQTWIKNVPAQLALDPSATRSERVTELMLAQLEVWREKLLAAASSGDTARVKEEAHRMKGSCLTVGATALADLCRSIEAAPELTETRAAEVGAVVAQLRAALVEERRIALPQVP